jgi:dGTPase
MYRTVDMERLAVSDDGSLPGPVRPSTTISDYRPPFARDYDRLVHAPAFRRLQGKTQVVTPGQADFFRTRLTHTIEVAQVARRLAYKLATETNQSPSQVQALSDVCEAAAILHDIGHPPFGHIGEEALGSAIDSVAQQKKWEIGPLAVGGHEGNAQNFRLVVWSLSYADSRGLNLTRAVLDASIKYPDTPFRVTVDRREQPKWNCYPTERWAYEWVRKAAPSSAERTKCLEAQIMDWSDDIAYATHDLEDWCRAGYIPLALLSQSSAARAYLVEQLLRRWSERGKKYAERDELENAVESLFAKQGPFSLFRTLGTEYDGSINAKLAVMDMRKKLFNSFVDAASIAFNGTHTITQRYEAALAVDPTQKLRNQILKEMVWIFVISHPRMATHQAGQRQIVKDPVEIYANLVYDDDEGVIDAFPRDTRERLQTLKRRADRTKTDAEVLRLVADHVSGMTDVYASMIHRRLTGRSSGGFNVFV